MAIQLLSRPFESGLLVLCVIPFLAPSLRRLKRQVAIAALVVAPAIGLTLLQNKQVTGSWTTVPYLLSRYQYGIPTTFTFQPNPVPHRELTAEQQLDYEAQSQVHGKDPETIGRYVDPLPEPGAVLPVLFSAAALSGATVLPACDCASRDSSGFLFSVLVFSARRQLSILTSIRITSPPRLACSCWLAWPDSNGSAGSARIWRL